MKYIRTKDRIYNIYDLYEIELLNEKVYGMKGSLSFIHKGDITCEADTIEELCDRFVLAGIDIIFLNKEHTQYRFEGTDEWFDITETELKRGIYGAIWIGKGLIYVAKMNDKGELELL